MASPGLEYASIAELSRLLDAGEVTSAELTEMFIARIEAHDGAHASVLTINPDALDIAHGLDAGRRDGEGQGALYGIPVLVKDNIDTGDAMPTTAGSLALEGTHAEKDASVVARLRQAGAVILGKTNLSEWANFRSTRSSSGWSGLGGQVRNAHDPARTPGGSSSGSGVATAAGFCAGAIGTETDGSIVSPSSMNGIVGFKPTVGFVSRSGIIPISSTQDTAGPMARTVADAARMLAAIAGSDPLDEATGDANARRQPYPELLDSGSLRFARIGVARTYCGYHDRVDELFENALDALRDCGAEVIDGITLTPVEDVRQSERIVMESEFKACLDAYLDARPPSTPVRSLADVIAFNNAHPDSAMKHFGQEIFLSSVDRPGLDDERYREARRMAQSLTRERGIDKCLEEHRLDALVAPTTTPAWLIDWVSGDNRRGGAACPAAVAGYPHATVPMGRISGLPVGLSIFSGAYRDAAVLSFAYAFEQATGHYARPPLT